MFLTASANILRSALFPQKLSMDIHPCQIRFSVSLNHAKEFPAIPFIKAGMIGNQIKGCDVFGPHFVHHHIQKVARNSLAPVCFFRIRGAYILLSDPDLFIDFLISLAYNHHITNQRWLILGWSKDPGPPSGGEFPRYF